MPDIKMVIFDLDGTLVDTPRSFIKKMREAGTRCGFSIDTQMDERAMKRWGNPLNEMFRFVFPHTTDEHLAIMRETFDELDRLEVPEFYPGCKEMLESFLHRDVVCTILTSRGSRSCIDILEQHGVHGHFRHIVARDNVEHPKPDARALTCTFALMEELGIKPEEAVLVGDTYDDLYTGKNSGIRTVIVRTGSFTTEDPVDDDFAFECIDSVADLPQLLFPEVAMTA